MYNLLLCDDEEDILLALRIYLGDGEYRIFEAHNGQEAVELVRRERIDLVLMDIMMPVKDGLTALLEIREFCNTPVILLTAKGESVDKVAGFEQGADDYIIKPFDPMDVKLRVRASLRRYTSLGARVTNHVLKVGGIELDDTQKLVFVNGEETSLTYSEYEILKLLMEHPGRSYSPTEIYEQVWKENPIGSERTVSVHIHHLREKIEIDPANPRYLLTVWGQGYRLIGAEEKG